MASIYYAILLNQELQSALYFYLNHHTTLYGK